MLNAELITAYCFMRIAEIFRSIQGEGRLTGTESIFVRTSGNGVFENSTRHRPSVCRARVISPASSVLFFPSFQMAWPCWIRQPGSDKSTAGKGAVERQDAQNCNRRSSPAKATTPEIPFFRVRRFNSVCRFKRSIRLAGFQISSPSPVRR